MYMNIMCNNIRICDINVYYSNACNMNVCYMTVRDMCIYSTITSYNIIQLHTVYFIIHDIIAINVIV